MPKTLEDFITTEELFSLEPFIAQTKGSIEGNDHNDMIILAFLTGKVAGAKESEKIVRQLLEKAIQSQSEGEKLWKM